MWQVLTSNGPAQIYFGTHNGKVVDNDQTFHCGAVWSESKQFMMLNYVYWINIYEYIVFMLVKFH